MLNDAIILNKNIGICGHMAQVRPPTACWRRAGDVLAGGALAACLLAACWRRAGDVFAGRLLADGLLTTKRQRLRQHLHQHLRQHPRPHGTEQPVGMLAVC